MEWHAGRGGGGRGLLGTARGGRLARGATPAAERHTLHLPDDGGGVICLLPPGLGKVLPQLLGHGAVDVLVPRGVARDPGVPQS